jgi:hypothetical protein
MPKTEIIAIESIHHFRGECGSAAFCQHEDDPVSTLNKVRKNRGNAKVVGEILTGIDLEGVKCCIAAKKPPVEREARFQP